MGSFLKKETGVRVPDFSCSKTATLALVFLCSLLLVYGEPRSNSQHEGALTIVEVEDNGEEDGVSVDIEGQELPVTVNKFVEDFVPTDEWQDVQEGQKIPPGLHVQMDFKTGKKQAKLMDKAKKAKVTTWDAGDKIGVINTEKPRYTRDQLKAALKDFKYQDVTPEEKKQEAKTKEIFRSYEDLKKAMKDMKMAVKTETEIVKELTLKLNESSRSSDNIKTILVDLEYYLHQIDNARLFCDIGGISAILKLMNSTEEELRESASHAIGAALQSNAKVQVAALESGVLNCLIRGLATDPSWVVRKRMLFALSTLMRQFPFAQQKFLEEGGLTALASLFKQAEGKNYMRIKIVTLLTDLLVEHDSNVKLSTSDDPIEAERGKQYQNIGMRESMTSTGWCSLMPSLLQEQQESAEHDSVEKVLQAMSTLAHTCANQFSGSRSTLQALMRRYSKLAAEDEDGDDYFVSIHTSLKDLVGQLYRDDL